MHQFIVLLFLFLTACSSLKKEVRIESNPTGADIINKQKQLIGQTPYVIGEADLSKIKDGDKIYITVTKPGYEARTIITELREIDTHSVNLVAQSVESFKKDVLFQHNDRSNELVRDILVIQGLLMAGQYQECEKKISSFEERYPNIAAVYVLRANIEMIKKNKVAAMQYLKKAEKIDPDDPFLKSVISRYQKSGDL